MPTLAGKTIVERKGENVADRQHDGVLHFKEEVQHAAEPQEQPESGTAPESESEVDTISGDAFEPLFPDER